MLLKWNKNKNKSIWNSIGLSAKDNVKSSVVDEITQDLKENDSDKIKFVLGERGTGKSSVINSSILKWKKFSWNKRYIKINVWKVFRVLSSDKTIEDITRIEVRNHLINRLLRENVVKKSIWNKKRIKRNIQKAIYDQEGIKRSKWLMISIIFMIAFMIIIPLQIHFNFYYNEFEWAIPLVFSFPSIKKGFSKDKVLTNFKMPTLTNTTTNDHLLEEALVGSKVVIHIEDLDRVPNLNLQRLIIEETIHLYGIKGIEVIVELVPLTMNRIFDKKANPLFQNIEDNDKNISEINEWKTKYAGQVFYIPKLSKRQKKDLIKKELDIQDGVIEEVLDICVSNDEWNLRQVFHNYNTISSVMKKCIRKSHGKNNIEIMTPIITLFTMIKEHHSALYEELKNKHNDITINHFVNKKIDDLKDHYPEIEYLLILASTDKEDHTSLGDYILYIENDVDRDEMIYHNFINSKKMMITEDLSDQTTILKKLVSSIHEYTKKGKHRYSNQLLLILISPRSRTTNSHELINVDDMEFNYDFWHKAIDIINDNNIEIIRKSISSNYKIKTVENNIDEEDFKMWVKIIASKAFYREWLKANFTFNIIDKLSKEQISYFCEHVPIDSITEDHKFNILNSDYSSELKKYIKGPVLTNDIKSIWSSNSFANMAKTNEDWEKIIDAMGHFDITTHNDKFTDLIKKVLSGYGMFNLNIDNFKDKREYVISDEISPVFGHKTTMASQFTIDMYVKEVFTLKDFSSIKIIELCPRDYEYFINHSDKKLILQSSNEMKKKIMRDGYGIKTMRELFIHVQNNYNENDYLEILKDLGPLIGIQSKRNRLSSYKISKVLRKVDLNFYNEITDKNYIKNIKLDLDNEVK